MDSENKYDKLPAGKHLMYQVGDSKYLRKADKFIQYLTHQGEGELTLTEQESKMLDRLTEIHNLRKVYNRNKDIIQMISTKYGVTPRQVQKDIAECEYIFGKFEKANLEYERTFLLECSRKNIQLAFATKNTDKISKALATHAKICGHDKEMLDLPDFSKLEQHNYILNVPDAFVNAMLQLSSKGAVNLDAIMPAKTINIDKENGIDKH